MPFLVLGSYHMRFELDGPEGGPAYVLVNGLTQYAELWDAYRVALVAKGFRVATFDLLGQGASDKPALTISQDDQVAALALLINQLGDVPIFLGGISFGGLIALRYAILHGKRLAGLVPMSCFAELPPQLLLIGNALRTGLILGGTSYLQDLLLPMNVSDQWLKPVLDKLDSVKRQGWLVNDVFALQNLMESFLDFQPLTPQLSTIGVPTMILNGEFDFLTPRALHETLRVHISNSSLVIIPRGYHAFTLEKPALTADLLARFAEDVLAGRDDLGLTVQPALFEHQSDESEAVQSGAVCVAAVAGEPGIPAFPGVDNNGGAVCARFGVCVLVRAPAGHLDAICNMSRHHTGLSRTECVRDQEAVAGLGRQRVAKRIDRARPVAAQQRLHIRAAARHHGGRPAEICGGEAVDQLGRDERQVDGADHDRTPLRQRQRLHDADHRVARRIGLHPDRDPRQAGQLGVGLGDHGHVAKRRAHGAERPGKGAPEGTLEMTPQKGGKAPGGRWRESRYRG
jgi:pimeloyl-ACP methyl ester carboxylesterase